ncbi:Cellulose synthase-like protein G1 [Sesamum angolense]|uniref:Cellulose synthase-like protein G1 n=1 Tax=Sesamum angolense TaxID=2727404 RepID=A0AAE2C1R1_9LAMI|nr:Cellulose synthase-like protein G1 [Sesamum angolense]
MEKYALPLSDCRVKKTELVINRLHAVLHGIALLALLYYRLTSLTEIIKNNDTALLLPHLLILISELILSFIWLLSQASKWKPVIRKAYPERLPGDEKLPPIDVFICTADPNKEPCLQVMNTVISTMALDYPPDKLHVYLSDDAGSVATLQAIKQAFKFSKLWVPFCIKYKVKIACPEAYFLTHESAPVAMFHSTEFIAEKKEIKKRYMEFKESVAKIIADTSIFVSKDHPPLIEVINDENGDGMDSDKRKIPLLVSVAREKRPSHPHHFKAGALNVLLRVSGMISNSPYILVLDCDMYCNDPLSACQAMCFHLNPELSAKLSFVQFPQRFYNINEIDINDGKQRYVWPKWEGFDGLNMGPILSGTCFYIKREALCGAQKFREDVDLIKLQKCFGPSNEFIKSISLYYKRNYQIEHKFRENEVQKELQLLASCTYDNDSEWGKEASGLQIHQCGGRLFYRLYYALQGKRDGALDSTKSHCRALIPQLYLIRGISLYPEVSSLFFIVFLFIFLSAQLKHVQEVFLTAHSIRTWSNEQRMWMMKALTSYLFAGLEVVMEKIGLTKTSFLPTNKVDDDQQTKCYQMGIYNFQAPARFMVPLCSLYMLNVGSLIIGFGRIMQSQKWGEMLLQAFIPLFATVLHFPLLEGMVLRKDKGRVSPSVSWLSVVISTIFLSVASLLSNYY